MKYSHHNLSPLDNRYRDKVSDITECFSESALIKVRFVIEIEWLIFLCTNYPKKFKPLSKASISAPFSTRAIAAVGLPVEHAQ